MDKRTALDTARYLKTLHADLSIRYEDAQADGNRKLAAQIGNDLDRVAKLNAALLAEHRKPAAKAKPQTLKVGNCPCGLPIMIAERYAVSLTGPTTIRRKCEGYRCGRTNEVIITARHELVRATWKALDCRCGAGIYLRSDYAGPGFPGWDAEGKSNLDLMIERKGDTKNRTVKMPCPRCDCKYEVRVRFTTEEGKRYRSISGSKVIRCNGCKNRAPVGQAS